MTAGNDYFSPWEESVSSWSAALEKINHIIDLAGTQRTLAWRGTIDASWSLHSSLFRRLLKEDPAHTPEEDDLVEREDILLSQAREKWRYDDMPTLEIFAHMQHYGGPTRFLDVTFNPLIALWFAVEAKYDDGGNLIADEDGRLLAFDVTGRTKSLNESWGGRDLPWRNDEKSGTWCNLLPLVWTPPSYNSRIPAQNSGFLLAGVPKLYSDVRIYYRKGPGSGIKTWSAEEVRLATSIPTRMTSLGRKLQEGSEPTFTVRIEKAAKQEIRRILETNFGYNRSTIYPDLFGMASELSKTHK